jgi:putative FmdB family regulatory protein
MENASPRRRAMPTYEYRCLVCDEVFEQPERISEHTDAHPKCPNCGSEKVEQVFSPFFAKTSKKS